MCERKGKGKGLSPNTHFLSTLTSCLRSTLVTDKDGKRKTESVRVERSKARCAVNVLTHFNLTRPIVKSEKKFRLDSYNTSSLLLLPLLLVPPQADWCDILGVVPKGIEHLAYRLT